LWLAGAAKMTRAKSNRGFTQLEPMISVSQLKQRYLFGVLDKITDSEGNPISDESLQAYINNAVSMLEHYLDIAIMPRCETEEKDYYANDYWQWSYFQLNSYPVIEIESIQVTYLRNENQQPEVALDIPLNWVRLSKDTGIVRLVPNNRFPAQLQIGQGGTFFPELFRRNSNVPSLWTIKYKHGFADGKVPVLMNNAIGLIASLQALSIAGNLVLGAGIASTSLSLDGLSQSISTTQSAENSAYSATRREYTEVLFGKTKDDPNSVVRILKDYYKGAGIFIV
jgi:hypothetical protein